jgi:hypothetical protein
MPTIAHRLSFVWLAIVCLALCCIHSAMAQELNPRAYVIAPVGTNVVNVGYSRLDGDLQFDGAVPITGATSTSNLVALGYYRTLDFFGRAANVSVAIPYGIADFYGTVVQVPRSAHRSGFLDSSVRFSVNLIGGPAMQPAQFAKWRQDLLLGISLKIVAPTGQYDPTRLINWGSNRWAFKPELGYSQRFGNFVVDAYASMWFFTENPEFFSHNMFYPGTQSQSQSSIAAFEGHLSYDFGRRLWVSLDANFWHGGETSLNGIPNAATTQKSSRVGFTASIPLTVHQSIRFSYSDGAYIRYGGDYRTVSLAWQYGWLGWPTIH